MLSAGIFFEIGETLVEKGSFLSRDGRSSSESVSRRASMSWRRSLVLSFRASASKSVFMTESVRLASALTGLQPSAKRALCLARRTASEKTGHAEIFVEIGPVNALTAADEAPVCAFARRAMR
jgi:hypothetical protein